MKTYRLVTTPFGNTIVQYEDNGILYSIPADEANTDYQAYLAWVAEGNTAEEWNSDAD